MRAILISEQHRVAQKEKEDTEIMYRLAPSALDAVEKKHKTTSRTELAALIGVSEATVRNLRRGSHQPKLDTVMEIQRLTGIPFGKLVIDVEKNAA